jgi:hypothetical protein
MFPISFLFAATRCGLRDQLCMGAASGQPKTIDVLKGHGFSRAVIDEQYCGLSPVRLSSLLDPIFQPTTAKSADCESPVALAPLATPKIFHTLNLIYGLPALPSSG